MPNIPVPPTAGTSGGSNFTGFTPEVIESVKDACQTSLNDTMSKLNGKMEQVTSAIGEVWYAPEAVQWQDETLNEICRSTTKYIVAIFQNYLNSIGYAVNYWYEVTRRKTEAELNEVSDDNTEREPDETNCPKMSWSTYHNALPSVSEGISAEDVDTWLKNNLHLNPIGGYVSTLVPGTGFVLSVGVDDELTAGNNISEHDTNGGIVIDTEAARNSLPARLTDIYNQIYSELSSVNSGLSDKMETLLLGQNQAEVVNHFFLEIVKAIQNLFQFIIGDPDDEESGNLIKAMDKCAAKYEYSAEQVKAGFNTTTGPHGGATTV